MEKATIYFIFTDTGTNLSRIINYCTRRSLNHVSIGFDRELTEVYSFGRTQPKNPFSGGFVREDIHSEFLRNSNSAIYSFDLTQSEYDDILAHIKRIEANKSNYRYNFMGLIGVLLQIEIRRKRAFFCSEFVATVVSNVESIELQKPSYFVTPSDIRDQIEMNLIYEGRLGDYRADSVVSERELLYEQQSEAKQSFVFLLSRKVKQFVIR
jgi:hypothetical protein